MIVDLHVHTNTSSRCSSITPQEMVDRALELGLDAVAVTEHSTYRGARVAHEYAAERGYKVFRGMEVYTEQGDMLVFGWETHVKYYLFPFEDLKKEVEKRDGIIIPAHPFRGLDVRHKHRHVLSDELLDAIVAIETRNGAITRKANEHADRMMKKYGLFGVGGSDAHHVSHLGRCLTILEDQPENERDLIEALRGGRYRAVYLEEMAEGEFGD